MRLKRPRTVEATEHFFVGQKEVAKSVQCGEQYSLIVEEATRDGGLKFLRQ